MRDYAVLLFLVACIALAFRRAWYGVLALAVFSYLSPHSYCWGFMSHLPAYKILFVAVVVAFLKEGGGKPLPKDGRIPAFFLLWAYFGFTTLFARVPEYAWPRFAEVSKIYAPLFLTVKLIDDRRKLLALIAAIAASVGLVATKGGLWALATGFRYRVYGPPHTSYYDNNDFAIATNVAIPLLLLWAGESRSNRLRSVLYGCIPFCVCASLASWSRGALLSLSATLAFLVWHSRRRWLALPLVLAGAIAVLPMLPEQWFGRMHSIESHRDTSAQQRLAAWRDGFNWTIHHPLVGCGFEGWRYVTSAENDSYYVRHLERLGVEVKAVDWHSSYVKVFAEHGVIAGCLWLYLLVGTLRRLRRLEGQARLRPELSWTERYALFLRAAFVAYATGSLFLGLTYWDLFYHLVFVSVLLETFAYEGATRAAEPASAAARRRSADGEALPRWRPPNPSAA